MLETADSKLQTGTLKPSSPQSMGSLTTHIQVVLYRSFSGYNCMGEGIPPKNHG
jgi:hypothetical protein